MNSLWPRRNPKVKNKLNKDGEENEQQRYTKKEDVRLNILNPFCTQHLCTCEPRRRTMDLAKTTKKKYYRAKGRRASRILRGPLGNSVSGNIVGAILIWNFHIIVIEEKFAIPEKGFWTKRNDNIEVRTHTHDQLKSHSISTRTLEGRTLCHRRSDWIRLVVFVQCTLRLWSQEYWCKNKNTIPYWSNFASSLIPAKHVFISNTHLPKIESERTHTASHACTMNLNTNSYFSITRIRAEPWGESAAGLQSATASYYRRSARNARNVLTLRTTSTLWQFYWNCDSRHKLSFTSLNRLTNISNLTLNLLRKINFILPSRVQLPSIEREVRIECRRAAMGFPTRTHHSLTSIRVHWTLTF